MSAPFEDHDDWAKEDCVCGHRRYRHANGTGPCSHTKLVRKLPADLPAPVPGLFDDPFAWPSNWPPMTEWPVVEQPCCAAFFSADEARAEVPPW